MGGLHAYYRNGNHKVGIVMDCNVISVYTMEDGGTDASCTDYILENDMDTNVLKDLCLSFEKDGYEDAEWMFGNANFWDDYGKKNKIVEIICESKEYMKS